MEILIEFEKKTDRLKLPENRRKMQFPANLGERPIPESKPFAPAGYRRKIEHFLFELERERDAC